MEPLVKGSEARLQRVPRARHPALRPPRTGPHRATPPHPQQETAQRIDSLDGLRAVSILIVLLGHASRGNAAPGWLWPLRDLGTLGVYLFFTISGFIITLLMLRERQRRGSISLRAFWQRRTWRILPPFAAACAGIAAVSALGLMQWHWQSFLGAVGFVKNTNLLQGDWFFGHFWSLSMEEQFYLFWPLLILPLLRRGRATAVLLAALLLGGPLALAGQALFYPHLANTLPCLPYLGGGCLLAVLVQQRHNVFAQWRARPRLRASTLLFLPLAAVLAAARWRDDTGSLYAATVAGALQPLACFVLVAETVLEDGLARRPLGWAPLRWIGLASYSMYLWQQIFLGPPEVYRAHWWITAWPQNILAAIACGGLAWLLVEKPVAALKRRLTRSPGALARPAPA
jgi:peptidoglycan/LPS O-acetylase OafA/YrhL